LLGAVGMLRPTAVLLCLTASATALADEDASIRSDSTVAPGDWSLQLALGRAETDYADTGKVSFGGTSTLAGLASLRYGLGERLTWAIPTLAFAYRFGDRGGTELVPFGGITSWGVGYSSVEGWIGQLSLGAGGALRSWVSPDTAVNLTASIGSRARWSQGREDIEGFDASFGPTTWGAAASAGLSHYLGERLVLNVGARASTIPIVDGELAEGLESIVEVGSVQSVGLRSLPLVELRISGGVTIDLHGSLGYHIADGTRTSRVLAGSTFTW
jgi:hypothetical protein